MRGEARQAAIDFGGKDGIAIGVHEFGERRYGEKEQCEPDERTHAAAPGGRTC